MERMLKLIDVLSERSKNTETLDKHEPKQLILPIVSKSVAKQYAEFCVRCNRQGLPLLELDDYIKQYCC